MMHRFTNVDAKPTRLSPVYGYHGHPLLPLREALGPIREQIQGLDKYIGIGKTECHYPSEHGLTREESAAIYIYTMEWGEQSLFRLLNAALRIEDRSVLKPWFGYLKLFDTALQKLPDHRESIWRGINADIIENYRAGMQLTWWSFASCSSSLPVVRQFLGPVSTLLMVEAKHGKSISKYSNFPKEDEIILGMGTRVYVKGDPLKHSALNVIQLTEIHEESYDDLASTLATLIVNKTDDSAARKYESTRRGSFLVEYPDLFNKHRARIVCLGII
jgi:hypothetical protein